MIDERRHPQPEREANLGPLGQQTAGEHREQGGHDEDRQDEQQEDPDPRDDIFALAIGGRIQYTIPGTMPMAIYLSAYYAPEITSFSDVDELVDYQFGFQIEALPQTIAFIGIRQLEISDGNSDYELDDDNIHFGVRLTF